MTFQISVTKEILDEVTVSTNKQHNRHISNSLYNETLKTLIYLSQMQNLIEKPITELWSHASNNIFL